MKLNSLLESTDSFLQTREEIEKWIEEHIYFSHLGGAIPELYTISDDLVVDVHTTVNLNMKKLQSFPFQFGSIDGSFYCSGNELTSLKGCPRDIAGGFDCSGNKLTSLKFGPREVGGDYLCDHNRLTTLEGIAKEIIGYAQCEHNRLTNLDYAPKYVGIAMDLRRNNFEGKPDTSHIDCPDFKFI